MSTISENTARLEALLFYYGEPIHMKKICAILDLKDKEFEEVLEVLSTKLEHDGERGLFILQKEGLIQLVTKPIFGEVLQKIVEKDLKEELTPTAVETLSIIAYIGPLGRAELDYIRGVNSSFILRSLVLRGLVWRRESKRRGGFYDYEVSFDFLKHVGLGGAAELPEYDKYQKILQRLRPTEETVKDK